MAIDWAGLGRFLAILAASILGGWLWSRLGLPLGWLMGAAIVTGGLAMSGIRVTIPKTPHRAGLILIGSSVGLTLSPDVAGRMLGWAPLMVFAAFLGIALACLFAPIYARLGRITPATAYFSLLPGGVIEMARIGEDNGADPTTIAAIHALRVGLVVGVLPLVLFAFVPLSTAVPTAGSDGTPLALLAAFLVGALGGVVGDRLGLPAAWLLGAVLSVGLAASSGLIEGGIPAELLAAAQVIVGMALGARFDRERMSSIPRAIVAGIPSILLIMTAMAGAASLAALATGQSLSSLVLAFSIGGMAEMVLTAKSLGQDALTVAAFQTVRAVIVNGLAGPIWRRLARSSSGPGGRGR